MFKQDDLVYLDPPYYPCGKSGFTNYHQTPFLQKEQEKLFLFCKQLDKKGIKFIMSNSPCTEIKEMYQEYNQYDFYIPRQMRNAKGKSDVADTENESNEILVWNFSELKIED
jgi:DNA adenine methylase